MKFRTEKNQGINDYDEYLAYDESLDTVEADPLYAESSENHFKDRPLYEADYQDNYQTHENYSEKDSLLSSEQADQHQALFDGPELRDNHYLDNIEREDALETAPNPINENNLDEEYPSRQAYLQSQQLQKTEQRPFQAVSEDLTEQGQIRRAKYSAKIDRFLTNGIIVVGVLLVIVLLIAFLV